MNTNELMIGNYVLYKGRYICKVYGITENLVSIEDLGGNTGEVYPRELYPIELSEDVLDICGFRFNGVSAFVKDDIWCTNEKGIWEFILCDKEEDTFKHLEVSIILESLHELQNIYRVFYKKDLDIDFNK